MLKSTLYFEFYKRYLLRSKRALQLRIPALSNINGKRPRIESKRPIKDQMSPIKEQKRPIKDQKKPIKKQKNPKITDFAEWGVCSHGKRPRIDSKETYSGIALLLRIPLMEAVRRTNSQNYPIQCVLQKRPIEE